MKKIILRDASTCCANCFEMLDPDIEVYVDNDNDVICKECAEQWNKVFMGGMINVKI